MRRLVPRVCCLLLLVSMARGQATWDFTSGTGAPLSLPSNITGGTITATNATIAFNSTSASSGYTGATAGNNANVSAASGTFNFSTSSYYTFTLTAAAGTRMLATAFKLGSRSTSTGPTGSTGLTLYYSTDNFATSTLVGNASVSNNSTWALASFPSFSATSTTGGTLSFRVYGSGGSGTGSGNWRIDDLTLTVVAASPGPTISTQPVDTNVNPGQTATFSVGATGTGTLSYQWRKNTVAIDTTLNPSAATAVLSIASASNADVASYDVAITDALGTVTSNAAALTVGTSITIDPTSLSAVFNGATHPVNVIVAPSNLTYTVTYNGVVNSPPTNAGSYAVVATITSPGFTGSASGTLVIGKGSQSINWTTNLSNTPLVGVPFSVSATASSGNTVRFGVATGTTNATSSGTSGATITITDTNPVTITADQAGDANTAAAPQITLTVTAINPPALSGTYTQNFDTLASGLPAGWRVFTSATTTTLGSDVTALASSMLLATTDWSLTTSNFRNVASALNGGITAADSTSTQAAYTNRALGVRQNNTSFDPGAAMGFNFATTGVNVTSISFSAQIVSAQANATTWLLQSGVGTNPTSWATLATFNDPGAFGATPITVTSSAFGTTLNNQSSVWLRVVVLSATTFGGTRDTFAIDNFSVATSPVIGITSQPRPTSVVSGQPASFTVGAQGTGTLTYQWRKNGTAIGGATGATLSFPSALTTDTGFYDVVVNDSLGSVTSLSVSLSASRISTTITFSNLSASYDGGQHAVVPAAAPGSASLAPVTYTGIGSTIYPTSTTAPINVGSYLVSTSVTDSEHQGSASDVLVISGQNGSTAPIVTTAPLAQTVTYGDSVTFTIAVTGDPAPTLQWRKDGVAIAGANSSTFTISAVTLADAGTYDVVVANSGGNVASSGATLTVNKRSQTITFTAPAASAAAGSGVKLTATASSGLPVSFSMVSGSGTISGNTLTGTSTSVVVRASQSGSDAYTAAPAVDQAFTFFTGGVSPFMLTVPTDQTVDTGATVTFTASASGTPAPTWQWQKDGNAIAGATSATLTLTGVTVLDAARYTVVATNPVASANASATLTVRGAPVITTPPAAQTVNAGASVTFSVTAAAFPAPTYQWRKNGAAISGATSATLALASVRATDAANYDVVIANSLGSTTSPAARLAVVVHDFSGEYFGSFAGASGDFALYVRGDGTAVFIGYLPGLGTALVTFDVVVDGSGNFSLSTVTAASTPADLDPRIAAAPRTVTLRGTLNDSTGSLTGSVSELGVTLAGTRAAASGTASAQAGFYQGAFAGTASGRGYVIVGADGQAFFLATNGTSLDGVKTTLTASGRLATTTAAQSTVDLGFSSGAVTGTVATAAGTATLTGAADGIAGTEHLINLSVRAPTGPGAATLITGFVVTGTAPKQVLIRAAGPAIVAAPFNVAGALADPALQVFRGSSLVAQNDNWSAVASSGNAIASAATAVGAFTFRSGSADAALLTTLAPGAYTVQVSAGAAATSASGIVLAEVYEVLETTETAGTRRLANLSARGAVAPGAPLIAGFVVTGTAPQRVLVRGIGPGLAAFGVTGALANPTLTLARGTTTVKTNDDWFRDADAALIAAAAAKVGAFPLGTQSLDAATLLYLTPGAYTVQVNAATGSAQTGDALVEIYEVP